MSTYLRHESLGNLATTLKDFNDRSVDLVAGASRIRAHAADQGTAGVLEVADAVADLTPDGVTTRPASFRVNDVANEGLATKLDIPQQYLKRMHASHPELWAANVNGWMERSDKKYLVRTLAEREGQMATVRAFLSDSYRTIDNYDVVCAVLAGVRSIMDPGGVAISGDLTERRMYLRLTCPGITAAAGALLERYRAPNGTFGRDLPLVSAGLVVRNSEVGAGAFSIVPRVTVQVCTNGLVMTKDAMREVHLGGKLDEGIIKWSAETERKNLELITSQTKDAVQAFLNTDYLQYAIEIITVQAGQPVSDAPTTIAKVSKGLGFSKTQGDAILSAFIDGADQTAGGIMQAMTAVAQALPDGDAAFDLESKAVAAMGLIA